MQPKKSTGLLRKSFDFSNHNIPAYQLFNQKESGFGVYQNSTNRPLKINKSIQEMESKIQNFQVIAKNKSDQFEGNPKGGNPQKFSTLGFRKLQTGIFQPFKNSPLNEKELRGSCSAVMSNFDYNKIKQSQIQTIGRGPQKTRVLNHQYYNQQPQQKIAQIVHINQKSPKSNLQHFTGNANEYMHFQAAKSSNIQKIQEKLNKLKKSSFNKNDVVKNTQKVLQNAKHINQGFAISKVTERNQKTLKRKSKEVFGFQLGPILGKGKFGQVYLARHIQTGFLVAIKKVNKLQIASLNMKNQFIGEIQLHNSLDHPNIVKFFNFFKDQQYIYLVMQYLNGGTLFDYQSTITVLSIKEAVQFLKDIIEAVNYMHERSIAHRDIKPQNIVISSEGVAKLCDFGWSALVETQRKTYCGTLDYAPPEIVEGKKYDLSVDIWCIGVLAYQLLVGKAPFQSKQRNLVVQKIVNVDKNGIENMQNIPQEAKQFILSLIQKDPNSRPKSSQLLNFRLFTMHLAKGKSKKEIK